MSCNIDIGKQTLRYHDTEDAWLFPYTENGQPLDISGDTFYFELRLRGTDTVKQSFNTIDNPTRLYVEETNKLYLNHNDGGVVKYLPGSYTWAIKRVSGGVESTEFGGEIEVCKEVVKNIHAS